MKKISYLFLLVISVVMPLMLSAQAYDVEMADTMRSNGKLYIVVAVLSIILVLTFVFLISIDRKVRRLEDQRRKQ